MSEILKPTAQLSPRGDSCGPEYLSIRGLHGTNDIDMEFPGPFSVFISDNGSGKTTALYILQALLSQQFTSLLRFKFDHLTLKFRGSPALKFTYKMLEQRPATVTVHTPLPSGCQLRGDAGQR